MHPELGEGVIIGVGPTGFARVFFRSLGERQVPTDALQQVESWPDRVISGLRPVTPDALERLWLAVEAVELPLLESVATLTAAKVDLLPHQVVLVHRVANAQPRRFLIADEVGLGKTIETALILRELAFRGELRRALVIVPAGLVDNWQQELNQVFDLNFEVFGSEGDVTDRKSNAFVRHNRLIVSIDTLKKRNRVRRLLEAPPWDLVVFDEAHHLSAYRNGRKVRKTENFKLAEALRNRCRDLLLLSATPHQGDHFRFWMLIRLLNPTLFEDEKDMVENRHRLNAVVIRRTKAEACAADGSPLFARRVVYTQGFTLSAPERAFYEALLDYLYEGYKLAAKQGKKGRALGFVMTVFQKIAASSFAAVKATLKRRLLMLTIQEAIERDELLDVEGRDRVLQEARALIQDMHGLPDDAVGRAQVDQFLAEARVQLLKKRGEVMAFTSATESYDTTETVAAAGEESVATMVAVALPWERQRIRDLLQKIPCETETKTAVLLNALKQLWHINPSEKVIVFATYLGSIEALKDAIERAFPDKGVEVLKGGDHGAKLAAQRRFRRQDGPQLLLCTAAGREGINLQFASILFNYDLPWNPMDLEQRIGRIHRYGQVHTAQVYNLVATDTIEGRIFLLLEEKLQGIAKTLGKIDEQGQVAEDFRAQVLGQLGSHLSYDRLYQEAILDPSLERSRQELEVALANANLAREVVFELFQDLEKFNLGQYKSIDDEGYGMRRLVAFAQRAAHVDGGEFRQLEEGNYELLQPGREKLLFTTDRGKALQRDDLNLIGLEHPVIKAWLDKYSSLSPKQRALIGNVDGNSEAIGLITVWQVTAQGKDGQIIQRIVRLGIRADGKRSPYLERLAEDISRFHPSRLETRLALDMVANLINGRAAELLHRELVYSGLLSERSSYSSRLLACLVVEP
ncbi:RNA polymerase-associated protein RapA [Moorella mulderi DSM 14980]|uniref:RNA polymerase-associated protein RapA n=2 Tax=Neomoorella TaxID=44260 RepID=A0A151AY25_9FIRM|nr:RNA polymerase-associated protein RapA [Moorella mulderi DSM 14980]